MPEPDKSDDQYNLAGQNWYTVTEACPLFDPPMSDRTLRRYVQSCRTGPDNGRDRIRMEKRNGQDTQTLSELFLRESASKSKSVFVGEAGQNPKAGQPVQGVAGQGAVGSVRSNTNGKRGQNKNGPDIDRLLAAKDEQIALLMAALDRERETANREREIAKEAEDRAREATETLRNEQRIRMADSLSGMVLPAAIEPIRVEPPPITPQDATTQPSTTEAEPDATPEPKKRNLWQCLMGR